MAESSQGPLGVPPSVWVTLIVACAGFFVLKQSPFLDTRPPEPQIAGLSHAPPQGQDVEARLWEDPFAAVDRVLAAQDSNTAAPADSHSVQQLRNELDTFIREPNQSENLILATLVSGAPYANDMETRRRARYALLAGLYRSGYLPVDNQHVGYVKLSQFYSKSGASRDIAAYEWFERDRAVADMPASHVLLLWLDQDAFRDSPLGRITQIADQIAPPSVQLGIMGPADSDGLRAMAAELQRWGVKPPAPLSRDVHIFSSRATASDQAILAAVSATGAPTAAGAEQLEPLGCKSKAVAATGSRGSLARIFERWSPRVHLYRSISNDDLVESAVFKELDCRHITGSEIALIAERDTLYARQMGKYFGHCLYEPRADPIEARTDDGMHPVCVSYLKGLDGATSSMKPGAPESGAHSSRESEAGPAKHSTQASLEDASGQSQFDYLRRLASSLAAAQGEKICKFNGPAARGRSDSERQCHVRYIKAIGVLSSDIYDKLLVLQALRPVFPDATFFTFDLDARLLEPDNLRWTHQLVVGSSLGLALTESLQGDIPAFRDSYQAATFFATMLAVHRLIPSATGAATAIAPADPDAGLQWTATPMVFEIGRNQPLDLNLNKDRRQACNANGECPAIGMTRASTFFREETRRLLFLSAVATFCLLIVAPWIALGTGALLSVTQNPLTRALKVRLTWLAMIALAACAVAIVIENLTWRSIIGYLTNDHTRMPVPIAEGISHWGTTALEIAMIFMVVVLVVRGQRKLRENADAICREFAFKTTVKRMIIYYATQVGPWYSKTGIAELLWFPLTQLSAASEAPAGDELFSPLERLIAQYLYRGKSAKRLCRVVVATVASAVLLYVLDRIGFSIFGSGAWLDSQLHQRSVAAAVSVASLAAMQFLIFWVADAMLLSRAFLLALRQDNPDWPPAALARERQALGLPADHAQMWSNLQLVARRTSWVTNLIWYPCLVIAGMALAVFTIQFGELHFVGNPTPLIISVLMTIAAAILLRRAAEQWRHQIIRRLEDERLRLLKGSPPKPESTAQVDGLLERISALHMGAFAPYSEQPVVRAVLVPAVTFAATSALQAFHVG